MTDTQTSTKTAGPAQQTLLNAFYGTVDPASVEIRQNKAQKDYAFGQLTVQGGSRTVDLYVNAALIEEFQHQVDSGALIFVQGEVAARGKGLFVSSLAPKAYVATIEKIHDDGRNAFGHWASVRLMVEGMQNAVSAMLANDDAVAAVGLGEGHTLNFEGAWRAEKNSQNGRWQSRLVSASSLRREEQVAA